LLIADEPTAGLDVSVQGEVLNLLARLRQELGIALLLITHNLAAVRLAAERLGVMYMGQLVETGRTAAVFRSPAHPYTAARSLRSRSPIPHGTASARSRAKSRACSTDRPAASSTRAVNMCKHAAAPRRRTRARSRGTIARDVIFR